MSNKAEIPLKLRRRIHLVDRAIKNLLPNMYPCDYNSSDHFVEGVLDEIRWFLVDSEELQGIERIDIEDYILDYKYDELTDYFNERCIVLKKDYLQEHIRKVLREETIFPSIDTKVVNTKGKPLIMYHGGSYAGGEFRGAVWFTTSKVDATYYAKQNYGIVTKAYLIVKNPLYTGYIEHLNIEPTKDIMNSAKKRKLNIKIEDGVISFIEANGGVLIAQDIGCDGVIDLHHGKILDVVVFSNEQIILI